MYQPGVGSAWVSELALALVWEQASASVQAWVLQERLFRLRSDHHLHPSRLHDNRQWQSAARK
jgi:hypothetical protein